MPRSIKTPKIQALITRLWALGIKGEEFNESALRYNRIREIQEPDDRLDGRPQSALAYSPSSYRYARKTLAGRWLSSTRLPASYKVERQ